MCAGGVFAKRSLTLGNEPLLRWRIGPCTTRRTPSRHVRPPRGFLERVDILADLDQNPGFGPSASMFCPTLVGHGTVHCYAKKRCMVPEEHLLAMGYPVFNEDFPHKYAIEHMLTKSEIKKFAGNAMYLPIIGMQMAYIIAKIEKTNKTTPVTNVKAGLSTFQRKHSGMSFSSGDGMGSPCISTPERRATVMSHLGSPSQSTP